jgi:hypothetical protein
MRRVADAAAPPRNPSSAAATDPANQAFGRLATAPAGLPPAFCARIARLKESASPSVVPTALGGEKLRLRLRDTGAPRTRPRFR